MALTLSAHLRGYKLQPHSVSRKTGLSAATDVCSS